MGICAADFDFVKELVFKRSAIVLDAGKEYLVENRLSCVIRKEGIGKIEELIAVARKDSSHRYTQAIVEAMTTNETLFFRDIHPFDALRTKIIPELIEKKSNTRTLNIWSAASSSGQEAYSVAMVLKENFPQLDSWTVRIIGTDINRQMVERAQSGVYTQLEVNRGLPVSLLIKYFSKRGSVEWQLADNIRSQVKFMEFNLIGLWPTLPVFDLVLLRNVLIYFDMPTKQQIISKIRKVSSPDALIFLGAAETMMQISEDVLPVEIGKCRCYRFGK